uniref:TetR/AcrR family transcriptional regulator n=1 Tax=Cellulomonas hominis TaxID=156981 RepID=UPI0018A9D46F|nr:TetR/AcrR family transcriptional regulator [Cellulomonas hominis]
MRAELIDAAQDLFVAQGYEGTTVDQIAAAVGMSRRSFFRYFASKDDLVLGKYDAMADQLAEALHARPADEPLWDSLRRVFDGVVDYATDPATAQRMAAMERIVQSNDALRASYLHRLDAIQGALVDAARERAQAAGHPWEPADPAPAAAVGAAFACMRTANDLAAGTGRDLSELLDETFGQLAAIVCAPAAPRP